MLLLPLTIRLKILKNMFDALTIFFPLIIENVCNSKNILFSKMLTLFSFKEYRSWMTEPLLLTSHRKHFLSVKVHWHEGPGPKARKNEYGKRENERGWDRRVCSEGENPSRLLASHRLACSLAGRRPRDCSQERGRKIKFWISCRFSLLRARTTDNLPFTESPGNGSLLIVPPRRWLKKNTREKWLRSIVYDRSCSFLYRFRLIF